MGKFGLNFFKPTEKFNGNWSVLEQKSREWEKMYRERWSHDKVVRTTHGVNCTGSCSWKVFVKNGVITWENQQTDYPSCDLICRNLNLVDVQGALHFHGMSTVL